MIEAIQVQEKHAREDAIKEVKEQVSKFTRERRSR